MRPRDLYRTAADAVLVMHFAFVLFALFGGLLVLVSRAWVWIALVYTALLRFIAGRS